MKTNHPEANLCIAFAKELLFRSSMRLTVDHFLSDTVCDYGSSISLRDAVELREKMLSGPEDPNKKWRIEFGYGDSVNDDAASAVLSEAMSVDMEEISYYGNYESKECTKLIRAVFASE